MKKNIIKIVLVLLTLGLLIILTQTNFIQRVKNKLFSETSVTNTEVTSNVVGDIYGIDVSNHQKNIDWTKVKNWKGNKISFVYIKATEGASGPNSIDKNYKKNFKGAKENNFLVGSYHYFRTTSSAEDQFNNFIKTVDKNKQDLIPLIDVEEKKYWNDLKFHENFQKFLDMVENHYGQKPMIYTVNSFYNHHLSGKYLNYHFLIGRYGKNPPNMKDKSSWTIWQFTETGKVNGIPKNVDIDVINKKYTLNDLLVKK
jgi:lysozyme